jgi:hypothetical protein
VEEVAGHGAGAEHATVFGADEPLIGKPVEERE